MKSRTVTSTFIMICLLFILFVGSTVKGYGDQHLSVVVDSQDSVTGILPKLGKRDQIDALQVIQSPFPKTPPDARKIEVSDPDNAGLFHDEKPVIAGADDVHRPGEACGEWIERRID